MCYLSKIATTCIISFKNRLGLDQPYQSNTSIYIVIPDYRFLTLGATIIISLHFSYEIRTIHALFANYALLKAHFAITDFALKLLSSETENSLYNAHCDS